MGGLTGCSTDVVFVPEIGSDAVVPVNPCEALLPLGFRYDGTAYHDGSHEYL